MPPKNAPNPDQPGMFEENHGRIEPNLDMVAEVTPVEESIAAARRVLRGNDDPKEPMQQRDTRLDTLTYVQGREAQGGGQRPKSA